MKLFKIKKIGLWLGLFCLAVCLLTIFMYYFVTSRYGIGADFSTFWNAGRALFIEHISPYDSLISERIQTDLYGRPAIPGEDQVRFAYPPFSLIIILPTVFMSFAWADAYWMAFNFIALFAAVIFAFRTVPRWVLLSMVFFLPISRSLILGQYALLLGTCLILVYGLIGRERPASRFQQFLAGMLLAWCLMKPQLTVLFLAFFLIHAFRQRYWFVYFGFVGAGLALGLLSFWLLPGWVAQWHALLTDYVGYVPIQPLYQVYASGMVPIPWDNWVGAGILLLAVAAVVWMSWKWWRDPKFDALLLMSLAIFGQIISPNPKSMISDQILFLLPLLIWIVDRASRFRWEKPFWWFLFILSAWITFIIFFNGQEPLQAEATLPLVSSAWLIWVYLIDTKVLSQYKGGT